ncbi:MAG TPA: NAD(P)H-dependent glycerol-3-phosphate dehydrogenase [Acetobacteraceae bacterium]|nr:NAD(P)H-dependent glycerol-3-phosphate dehydrogenase [Acetobacteraceae bacterium]
MNSVAVIGAGAWGTALTLQAARAGASVTLWARDPAPIAASRHSPHLPGITLPGSVRVTGDLGDCAQDLAVLAVPMQHVRAVLARLPPGPPLLLAAKGVEQGRLRLPLEIAAELHPGAPAAFLTGPSFAAEVARGLPTACVVAADDPALRRYCAGRLATPSFRLYGNADPVGAQVGAAAKNVIAIAAGGVIGAGFGENARAALVTRGLAELSRLVVRLGGRAETVAGLSGLGDLLLTCTGPSSRNFAFGAALGRGATPAEALAASRGVAEGVATAPALVARAGTLDLPVCRAVADLLAGRLALADAAERLLARPRRDE